MRFIIGLVLLSVITSCAGYKEAYIQDKISRSVVKITDKTGKRGGTGFHVKGASGETVIVTNAHVCELGRKQGYVYVASEAYDSRPVPRRILEQSVFTDLCAVEALPGAEGLPVAKAVYLKEVYTVTGHPALMPLARASGQFLGLEDVDVPDHVINRKNPDDKCDDPKNRIVEMDFFFFSAEVCMIHITAVLSNIQILPGNSGSPATNSNGEVVGVVFAGNNESMWGLFISLADLQKFLSVY